MFHLHNEIMPLKSWICMIDVVMSSCGTGLERLVTRLKTKFTLCLSHNTRACHQSMQITRTRTRTRHVRMRMSYISARVRCTSTPRWRELCFDPRRARAFWLSGAMAAVSESVASESVASESVASESVASEGTARGAACQVTRVLGGTAQCWRWAGRPVSRPA